MYYAYVDHVRFSGNMQFIRFDLARIDYQPPKEEGGFTDIEVLDVTINHKHKKQPTSPWFALRAGRWVTLHVKPIPQDPEAPVIGRYYLHAQGVPEQEAPQPRYVLPHIEGGVPRRFLTSITVSSNRDRSMKDLMHLINKVSPTQVTIANVGQAACVAILGHSGRAAAYFDVGWPIGVNSSTRPRSFIFCTSDAPPVFLSHWDMDHWFGAKYDRNLLKSNWVVPTVRNLGKSAAELARHLALHNRLFVWKGIPGQVVVNHTCSIAIGQATGVGRNHSGLVMLVKDINGNIILYPGDCDYRKLPCILPLPNVLIATHHGGDFPGSFPPRPATFPGWCAISYGNGNSYRHPSPAALSKLRTYGWVKMRETPRGSIGVSQHLWSTPCNNACSCLPKQHF